MDLDAFSYRYSLFPEDEPYWLCWPLTCPLVCWHFWLLVTCPGSLYGLLSNLVQILMFFCIFLHFPHILLHFYQGNAGPLHIVEYFSMIVLLHLLIYWHYLLFCYIYSLQEDLLQYTCSCILMSDRPTTTTTTTLLSSFTCRSFKWHTAWGEPAFHLPLDQKCIIPVFSYV